MPNTCPYSAQSGDVMLFCRDGVGHSGIHRDSYGHEHKRWFFNEEYIKDKFIDEHWAMFTTWKEKHYGKAL